jgi:hypothetical protein
MMSWDWLRVGIVGLLGSLGLILIRLRLPVWKNQTITVLGEGRGRLGSVAVLVASVFFAIFSGSAQDAYLIFSFLPFFVTEWIRVHRGDFAGQTVFMYLSWALAGISVVGENSFINQLGLSEMAAVLLAGSLVALVSLGYSKLVMFKGLSSWWGCFLVLNLFFVTDAPQIQLSSIGFILITLTNGLWAYFRNENDVDQFAAGWMGFWLANQFLSAEMTGVSSRDSLIWLILLSLPLLEGILKLASRVLNWQESDGGSFLIRLKCSGLPRRHWLLYLLGMGTYSALAARSLLEVKEPTAWLLVGAMGFVGITMFFGFNYLSHHLRKHQVHNVSQTLLQRYLRLEKTISLNVGEFQAVVYDLLPYYRKLEQGGIGEIQGFLHDFGGYLRNHHANQPSLLVGSYTVLVVEGKMDPPGRYLTDVTRHYFAFLESKGLHPTVSPGYFSSQSKADQFLQRFGHLIKSDQENLESTEAA